MSDQFVLSRAVSKISRKRLLCGCGINRVDLPLVPGRCEFYIFYEGSPVLGAARELREHASRRGWQVVGEYADYVSGAKERRPTLDRLMRDAKRRKFDVLLCWKLDRIGRSLKHLVNMLAELEALGVALVSLSDSLDLSTPQGRLMFQIIAAMAEFERALIQERVRAGMRNAKVRGKVIGRPAKTYLSQDARRSIWEAHKRGGVSLRQLATQFSTSLGTVQRSIQMFQRLSD